jgi:drug/metabolite transporter (DMT)-like permease
MVLAPFHYTQIVWMVLAGYVVFGDWPGPSTLVGGAIVIAAGLYVLYRESVRRRE